VLNAAKHWLSVEYQEVAVQKEADIHVEQLETVTRLSTFLVATLSITP